MFAFRYILAFGSNLGNPIFNCERGESALARQGSVLWVSSKIYTKPLPSPDFEVEAGQNDFLNYIVEFESDLSPEALYQEIFAIENEVGHDRTRKWAPRHLDIDILYACKNKEGAWEEIRTEEPIQIPHPEIKNRGFLLELLDQCDHLIHALGNGHQTRVDQNSI